MPPSSLRRASSGTSELSGANVLHLDRPSLNELRSWPPAWTVHPDPADPSRGTLESVAEEPERSDSTARAIPSPSPRRARISSRRPGWCSSQPLTFAS
jgi:hypothetical protein